MIYHDIHQYIQAKERWNNVFTTIINGEGFCESKGQFIPFKEYISHNPKPVYEPRPSNNEDGTHIPAGNIPQHKRR